MKTNWNSADKWLIKEVEEKLKEDYQIDDKTAEQWMNHSSFYPFLEKTPEFAHHEGPEKWAKTIVYHNGN